MTNSKTNAYLPNWATTAEACAYLEQETGEPWPLARLLEAWPRPSIWLEYSPDAPPELFGDRIEGIFAPLVFANDHGRMSITRTGLMTMTRLPNGNHCRFSPGIKFDLAELRYSRADLLKLVQGHERQEAPAADQDTPETWGRLSPEEKRTAMQEGHPLADFLPFAVHTTPSPRKDCRHTGKREKQIQTIEATARTLKYEPLDIPEGGRAAIKAHCLEHHFGLFTDSGFEHAWKEANRQGRIRIYRKERFLAR